MEMDASNNQTMNWNKIKKRSTEKKKNKSDNESSIRSPQMVSS